MKKIFVFSSAIFLSGSIFFLGLHKPADPFPSQREFQITYQMSIPEFPLAAERIRIWIPIASTREGQTILERKIKSPVPYQITREPVYGNEMAYFELERPFPPSLDFNVIYKAQTHEGGFLSSPHVLSGDPEVIDSRFSATKKDGSLPVRQAGAGLFGGRGNDRPTIYLKSSRLMVVNDTVRMRTRDAVLGKGTLVEKARGIYEDVIGRMRYDKTVPGWGRGDTARACLLGKGNCTDFHSLFISMAHAAEIPARFKIGLTVPDGAEGAIPGYHCWAEFYEEDKGWKPVDASEAWKNPKRKEAYFGNFDTNKFLISVGRDIDLVPKQAGPPVNIFFYPYVEVDGKEWNQIETGFQFKSLKATKPSLRGSKLWFAASQ